MDWFKDVQKFSSPLAFRMYKLVLHLEHLGPVLDKYVVQRSKRLLTLDISSKPGTIYFNGTVKNQSSDRLYQLGYPKVSFLSEFNVQQATKHLIDLSMKKFRLANPQSSSVDLMRVASRFIPGIKQHFLRELCLTRPELFSLPEASDMIVLDASYFLRYVPSLVTVTSALNDTKIIRVHASRDNKVHIYIQSNLLLVKMVDYFGPEYLSLEEIQDQDAIELLWQQDV